MPPNGACAAVVPISEHLSSLSGFCTNKSFPSLIEDTYQDITCVFVFFLTKTSRGGKPKCEHFEVCLLRGEMVSEGLGEEGRIWVLSHSVEHDVL